MLHGSSARSYAEKTIPKWRSGQVEMSGMVAQRLFALMPPFLPIERKHKIVETLWKRHGPSSYKCLHVGPDSDFDAMLRDIEDHFDNLAVLYEIPDGLQRRFDWLAENDVTVKQQLLNYFMDAQRTAAIANAKLYLRAMLDVMSAEQAVPFDSLTHTVYIGNHRLELRAAPSRSGYTFTDSPWPTRPQSQLSGCSAAVLLVALIAASTWFAVTKHV